MLVHAVDGLLRCRRRRGRRGRSPRPAGPGPALLGAGRGWSSAALDRDGVGARGADCRRRRTPTSCWCTTPPGRSRPPALIRGVVDAVRAGAGGRRPGAAGGRHDPPGRRRRAPGRRRRPGRAADRPDSAGLPPGRAASGARRRQRSAADNATDDAGLVEAHRRPCGHRARRPGGLQDHHPGRPRRRRERLAAAADPSGAGYRGSAPGSTCIRSRPAARAGSPACCSPDADGCAGHSDGDVAAHALCDALLAAAGLGDLGAVFGTADPRWAAASGRHAAHRGAAGCTTPGWSVVNASVQVIANTPRLAPRRVAGRGRALGRGRRAGLGVRNHHRRPRADRPRRGPRRDRHRPRPPKLIMHREATASEHRRPEGPRSGASAEPSNQTPAPFRPRMGAEVHDQHSSFRGRRAGVDQVLRHPFGRGRVPRCMINTRLGGSRAPARARERLHQLRGDSGSSSSTVRLRTASAPSTACATAPPHSASSGTVQPPVTSNSTPKPIGPTDAIR